MNNLSTSPLAVSTPLNFAPETLTLRWAAKRNRGCLFFLIKEIMVLVSRGARHVESISGGASRALLHAFGLRHGSTIERHRERRTTTRPAHCFSIRYRLLPVLCVRHHHGAAIRDQVACPHAVVA